MKISEREFKLNIWLVVIFGIIFLFAGVSIFFNNKLSTTFHLKPDLSQIESGSLEVHFLDTGEGDAILARLPNGITMIIDSGTMSRRSDIVSYIDKVFFDKKDKIFDYAIMTHSDIDHSGNMLYVLENYQVKNFYRPKIFSRTEDDAYSSQDMVLDSKNYDAIISKLNSLEKSGDTKILYSFAGAETTEIKDFVQFLSPNRSFYDDENMYSPIIKLSHNDKSILLTGDATIENEIEVINAVDDIDIDVLKLAHHGSKTSTSRQFLEATSPQFAIISYGENSAGHPSSEVLNNIKDYSKDLYNNIYTTFEEKNIVCHIDSGEIKFTFVDDIGSYIFVDYYYIAIAIMGICLIVVFFPKRKKEKKN